MSTNSPKIEYLDVNLPISQLNIYFDFFSIFKKEIYINRTNILLDELKISDIKKLVVRAKPSNFKSFILNNISEGSVKGYIDLIFSKNLELSEYKLNGILKKTNISFLNKFELDNFHKHLQQNI